MHHVEPSSGRDRERSRRGEPAGEIPSVFREGTLIRVNRLSIALVCYAVLGALTWATIADPKIRAGTLVILALFAVKSVLRRNDVLHPDKGTDPE